MGMKRRNRSEKKKDSVRFVVIKPKSTRRMKLPGRLFQPEQTRTILNVRAKALPLESFQPNLSLPKRIVAALIAAVCLCGGLVVIVLSLRDGEWLLVPIGTIVAWYGLAWVRVAHEGSLPGGRLRLNPWYKG